MSDYITSLSQLFGVECARLPRAVLYGENITNGSRIVGMCRRLVAPEGGRIINVGNCEATHIGAGFGMMMNSVHSVLFAKQHDFMLLGVDHFVNTYNFIRCARDPATLGAFTIVAVICDQGYQGPQSSFHSLGDVCSMARIPGFLLTNAQDAPRILRTELSKPGFRVMALSQRMFSTELMDPGFVWAAPDNSVFQYTEGKDATVVSFNFAFQNAVALCSKLHEQGLSTSLFSANHVFPLDDEPIIRSACSTGRIIVIDDSKSANLSGHRLLHAITTRQPRVQCMVVERGSSIDFGVCDDGLPVDYEAIVAKLSQRRAA